MMKCPHCGTTDLQDLVLRLDHKDDNGNFVFDFYCHICSSGGTVWDLNELWYEEPEEDD